MAASRKKPRIVDAPIVYKEGEESWTVFGWCSTGHHEGCRVEFPGHKCSCDCHGGVDVQKKIS